MNKEFLAKAEKYWTKERLDKLLSGKKLLLTPANAPELLRIMGLLNKDASMSANDTSKFLQINHMANLIKPHLGELIKRHKTVRILDAGCGNSFLTLILAWMIASEGHKGEIIGIDRNEKVIAQSRERSRLMGYDGFLKFDAADLSVSVWRDVYGKNFGEIQDSEELPRPHLLIGLHACDTATDHAISLGLHLKSDIIAVAPCCQAELARKLSKIEIDRHPLNIIFKTPNLRRESAAHFTDAMRMLILRSCGYEVTATEFVDSTHTPKNRLIIAERRGRFLLSAKEEYLNMAGILGNNDITLRDLVADMEPYQPNGE